MFVSRSWLVFPCSLALAALTVACSAEDPNPVDPTDQPDGGPASLEPPRLTAPLPPTRTPLGSIALRGETAGERVVVKGGAEGDVIEVPLPSGSFCVDVPIVEGTANRLEISSLGDGAVSPPAVHTVTQDPAAPAPANPYCSPPACGGGPCPTTESACSDSKDNDFDGWVDDCDEDCNGCTEDAYAPNHYPANVPTLLPETYDMKLCPCHGDWFAFHRDTDQSLYVKATHDVAAERIKMKLFLAEEAENEGYLTNEPVDTCYEGSSYTSLYYRAEQAGTYYLYIYVEDKQAAVDYTLLVK